MYFKKGLRWDKFVTQCFTGGIRKYIGSMKKGCIGLGFASPNTTFFMDPIYFRIPPVKHCITNSIHRVHTKAAQIPWKIRSNSWENLTHYYLLTCCIVVNVKVWEIGRGKQAAGQSRAPGQVMWTKCFFFFFFFFNFLFPNPSVTFVLESLLKRGISRSHLTTC